MKRVLVLLAIVLLVGCGSDDGNDQAAGDTSSGGGSVELTATEFKFDPSTVEVDNAGETTFTLVNDGQFTHALEIEGQGIEEESEEIDGGATTELTVDLEAGEYELYCPSAVTANRGWKARSSSAAQPAAAGRRPRKPRRKRAAATAVRLALCSPAHATSGSRSAGSPPGRRTRSPMCPGPGSATRR